MLEAIGAFIQTVWPRLFACLIFGLGTAFIPWMFEIAWWTKLLLSMGILSTWLVAGIVIEIVVAVQKRAAERQAAEKAKQH